ncbi:hypothetical protein BJ684DRAFT_14669 [Piptocephalis cylindrospora]|uniref:Uncharacterized protein n=1 Tax=Piptocephalis cylindrospora TaxID=1907219 RepID=A0A4V1IYM2_9FUNG|nr:hypothetical protein BJ684DRAFT_14669 [Piptocephalis cylindrospora]|eukprot:RKP15049.1 hypothetical protein BJ684DRAFT_14669 [Piptocephalis cylindrospora]
MHFRKSSSSSSNSAPKHARRPSDFLMDQRAEHEAAARSAPSLDQNRPSALAGNSANDQQQYDPMEYAEYAGNDPLNNRYSMASSSTAGSGSSNLYHQSGGNIGSVDGAYGKTQSYGAFPTTTDTEQNNETGFPGLERLSRDGANRTALDMDQDNDTGFPGLTRDHQKQQSKGEQAGASYYPRNRGDGTSTPTSRISGPYHSHPEDSFHEYDQSGQVGSTEYYNRELGGSGYGYGGMGQPGGVDAHSRSAYRAADIKQAQKDIKRGRRRSRLGHRLHIRSVEEKGDEMQQRGQAIVKAADGGYTNVDAGSSEPRERQLGSSDQGDSLRVISNTQLLQSSSKGDKHHETVVIPLTQEHLNTLSMTRTQTLRLPFPLPPFFLPSSLKHHLSMTQVSTKSWSNFARRSKGTYTPAKPKPAEGMVLMMSSEDEEGGDENDGEEKPLQAVSMYGDQRSSKKREDTDRDPPSPRATSPRKARLHMTMGSIKRGVGQMVHAEGLVRSGDRLHTEGKMGMNAWKKREWHLEQANSLREKVKGLQKEADAHQQAAEKITG